MRVMKRVLACALVLMMMVAMSTAALACTTKKSTTTNKSYCTTTSNGVYKHIDVRVDANFEMSTYVDGKQKDESVTAKVSNVVVKLDGTAIEMQTESTQDENSKKGVYEYKSVAGHTSRAGNMSFGETSTVEVAGDLTYTYNNETKTIKFNQSMATSKSNNVCAGSGNSYGFDLVISSRDIQNIVDNTVINVSKEWKDEGNESKRPETIKVDVLQNGKTYKTIDVKASENWVASVDGLPNGEYVNNEWKAFEYSVKEQAVEGYTSAVKYDEDKDAYVITNTYSKKEEASLKNTEETKKPEATKAPVEIKDETAPKADTPKTDDKKADDTKVEPTVAPTEAPSGSDDVPNTGDETPIWLFIVIGVVAVGGMVAMIVMGIKKK